MDVQGKEIAVIAQNDEDYISLSDIARHKDPLRTDYIVQNWIRSRTTIEYLGIWEQLNNPGFNSIEFDGFRKQAGLNSFILTPKQWIEKTNAIGIISKTPKEVYSHEFINPSKIPLIKPSFQHFLFNKVSDRQSKNEYIKNSCLKTIHKNYVCRFYKSPEQAS